MTEIKRIVGINLLITLLTLLIVAGLSGGLNSGEEIMIFSGTILIILFFINLIIAAIFFSINQAKAKAFLLSSFVILIVGFSFCSIF